jgi:hypothetical protein
MTPDEAKIILRARRVSGRDDTDPEISQALALSQAHPELRTWLEQESRFDASIQHSLQQITPPADLKARILAGSRASLPAQKMAPTTRRNWLWGLTGAAAAVVAGHFTAQAFASPFSQFRTAMIDFFEDDFQHRFDLKETNPQQIKAWLNQRNEPVAFDPGGPIASAATFGCRVLSWKGKTATLVCFQPESSAEAVHVFMIEQPTLLAEVTEQPRLERASGWNTAAWARGGKTYLAISQLPLPALATVIA